MSDTQNSVVQDLLGGQRKKRSRRTPQEILAEKQELLAKAEKRVVEQSIKNDPRAQELIARRASLRSQKSQVKNMLNVSKPNNIIQRIARAEKKLIRLNAINDNSQGVLNELDSRIEEIETQMATLYDQLCGEHGVPENDSSDDSGSSDDFSDLDEDEEEEEF